MEIVTVRSTASDGRVIVWERHPEHPNGEVFVVGDKEERRVALTSAVLAELSKGRLEIVFASPPSIPVVEAETEDMPFSEVPKKRGRPKHFG